MARVTVEDCLRKVNSRFALVHLAVRRALQLRKGSSPLVNAPKNKEIVVALREIAAGKVTFENILELEGKQSVPEIAPSSKATSTETGILSSGDVDDKSVEK